MRHFDINYLTYHATVCIRLFIVCWPYHFFYISIYSNAIYLFCTYYTVLYYTVTTFVRTILYCNHFLHKPTRLVLLFAGACVVKFVIYIDYNKMN